MKRPRHDPELTRDRMNTDPTGTQQAVGFCPQVIRSWNDQLQKEPTINSLTNEGEITGQARFRVQQSASHKFTIPRSTTQPAVIKRGPCAKGSR